MSNCNFKEVTRVAISICTFCPLFLNIDSRVAGSNCNYSIGFRVFSFSRIISLKFMNKIVIFKGNHGEDVKECYYYLDSTPTHSYMKALYKYPQNEYPYSWLVDENRKRSRQEPEFELCDTGRRILLHYSVNSEFF